MRVLLDMDGVLVNLFEPAVAFHGATLPIEQARWDWPLQLGFRHAWDPACWDPLDRSFWASLPWTAEGKELLSLLETRFGSSNILICTTPTDSTGCCDGKRDWIRREIPFYERRFCLTHHKDWLAAPDVILVDDRNENVADFVIAGGKGALVPRPWNQRRERCLPGGAFCVASLIAEIGRQAA